MSTITEKLVDFDIMVCDLLAIICLLIRSSGIQVESEPRKETPGKPSQLSEHTSALEESIFRLSGMLTSIERSQK
jgi:hypothetical protein